jgi:hypothetical protein
MDAPYRCFNAPPEDDRWQSAPIPGMLEELSGERLPAGPYHQNP